MRCPNCGSKMIYPGTEHKHFSGGKAVAGMVVFGVIGGAAGFIGKDTKGYRCSACGAFCQETMPFGTESAINSAVNAAKHNHDFAQYNLFRETYQNLEPIIPVGDHTALQTGPVSTRSQATEEDAAPIKRTYQPNAYVCDCPVFVEAVLLKTRDKQDFLSFAARNKSANTIRSAYIDVKVLDDAGDSISDTNCVFQGLTVSSGEYLPIDKEFPLNTDLAFKVEFRCVKVTFVDDTVWRDEGQPVHLLAEQDVITEENFAKYKALQLKFAENNATKDAVIYQPVVTEHYVQCVCGHPFNPGARCYHCGRDVAAIGELISFDVLDQYEKEIIRQRAQTRYKECQEFKNGALARQYAVAQALMKEQDVSALEEAHALFTLLGNYHEAKAQAALCYERKTQLEEAQAKEEAARLAAERKAEEERLAREKSKKKKRKILLSVAASVACVAIAFVVVLNTVIIPNQKYNEAIALMEGGNYTEAIAAFEVLDDYKDSKQQITKSKYDYALSLMNEGELDKAYAIFVELEDYNDSNEKASEVRLLTSKESLKDIKVGSCIKFGMYEQDNDTTNGKEYIDWLVLEVKDGKAFVISKQLLDRQPYHTDSVAVTWETCSLRNWLNNEFLNNAFTAEEQEMIPAKKVSADKNPEHKTDPGKVTSDKVFLLSFDQAIQYISMLGEDCTATDYVTALNDYLKVTPNFWLRTPGETQESAMYFGSRSSYLYYEAYISGEFDDIGNVSLYDVIGNDSRVGNDSMPVRPAMWIDLSKID